MTRGYFEDLGARVQLRWNAADADEERFADIAREELERTPPVEHVDLDGFVERFLAPDQAATRQFAPLGAFGQPGITAYHGRGFVIDLYFWNNCAPAIHDHPFSGVFTVLRGFSLHRTYAFQESARLGAHVRVGEIIPQELTVLRPGEVRPFSLSGHALIHTLIHVPNPSVSLVVRTSRVVGYHRYFPPSVALEVTEADDPLGHQLMLLDWLRNGRSEAYVERLRAFLSGADFETTFRAVSAAYQAFAAEGRAEELFAMIGSHHAERAALIPPAIRGAYQLQAADAIRQRLSDEDDRLVASALMCAANRDELFAVLREAGVGDDPAAAVLGWAKDCDILDAGDPFSPVLLRRLLAGDALERIVQEEAGLLPEPPNPDTVSRLHEALAGSIFKALV